MRGLLVGYLMPKLRVCHFTSNVKSVLKFKLNVEVLATHVSEHL